MKKFCGVYNTILFLNLAFLSKRIPLLRSFQLIIKQTKFLIISLLLLTLISPQAATLTVENTNDSGTGSLREAITNANDGDEVVFASSLGTVTILLSSQISVNKNITINGDGRITIDGQKTTRLLEFVFQTEITLKNITLQNGQSTSGSSNPADDRGGAIKINSQAKILFENVTFLNNVAGGYGGGAVGATGTNTQMTFSKCEFKNNACFTDSFNGAGAVALFAGGADTFVKTSECVFENNEGINGGAIGSSARIEVVSCVFRNNSTLFAKNNGFLSTNDSGRGDGGAIFTDRPEHSTIGHQVINSDFINNKSSGTGGAVFLFLNSKQQGIIRGCYFEGNSVVHSAAAPGEPQHPKGFGGAVLFGMNGATPEASEFILENSTFYKNTAWNEGGGVWITRTNTTTRIGKAFVRNCTFVENSAKDAPVNTRRGGALTTYFDTDVENCTFSGNSAQDDAGAISHLTLNSCCIRTININNCIFHNNTSGDGSIITDDYQGKKNLVFPQNTAGGNIPDATYVDPLLDNLANNGGFTLTMALQPNSPAIDAGDGCTTKDQRGADRVGVCDLGAFEFGGTPDTTVNINPTTPNTEGGKIKAFNILSPNADGQNDQWQVLNLESVDTYSIKVFTKTGQVVMESSNYRGDWAGTYQNNPLPSGIYYYIITTNQRGVKDRITGFVTLIR